MRGSGVRIPRAAPKNSTKPPNNKYLTEGLRFVSTYLSTQSDAVARELWRPKLSRFADRAHWQSSASGAGPNWAAAVERCLLSLAAAIGRSVKVLSFPINPTMKSRSSFSAVASPPRPLAYATTSFWGRKKGAYKQLVYYWYQQRGQLVANEFAMKWNLFKDALLLNRTDGALVRLTTQITAGDSEANAEKRLQDFFRSVQPLLNRYIPE